MTQLDDALPADSISHRVHPLARWSALALYGLFLAISIAGLSLVALLFIFDGGRRFRQFDPGLYHPAASMALGIVLGGLLVWKTHRLRWFHVTLRTTGMWMAIGGLLLILAIYIAGELRNPLHRVEGMEGIGPAINSVLAALGAFGLLGLGLALLLAGLFGHMARKA